MVTINHYYYLLLLLFSGESYDNLLLFNPVATLPDMMGSWSPQSCPSHITLSWPQNLLAGPAFEKVKM